jgi:hypothetical protein
MTIGSYIAQGQAAIGKATIRFDAKHDSQLAIPIAGYPMTAGNTIELVQNGQRHPILIENNPENSWAIAYASVKKGTFYIELSSTKSSAWLAIEAPVEVGKLDAFTKLLFDNYFLFILLGIIVGISLLAQQSLVNRAGIESV